MPPKPISSFPSRFPLHTVWLKVPISSRDDFFSQFNKLAGQQGFTPRISRSDPVEERFSISMFRRDIEVLGSNPFDLDVYQVEFYASPNVAVPPNVIDPLFDTFRRTMAETPGVVIAKSK